MLFTIFFYIYFLREIISKDSLNFLTLLLHGWIKYGKKVISIKSYQIYHFIIHVICNKKESITWDLFICFSSIHMIYQQVTYVSDTRVYIFLILAINKQNCFNIIGQLSFYVQPNLLITFAKKAWLLKERNKRMIRSIKNR